MKKLILICLITMLFSSCKAVKNSEGNIPEAVGELSVSVLKIGKADAIIVKTDNHTVLIDSGEKDDGKEILGKLGRTKKIDYLIITHFDKDHVGGAAEVIEQIPVINVITPNYEGTNEEYKNFIRAVDENNISLIKLHKSMSFTLDDVLFKIYPPEKLKYNGDNDYSLVTDIIHGENTFLFAGDAEKERLSELRKQIKNEYTFLKVPHHGRYNSATENFLKAINPKYAVITCSDKNPPESEVLEILNSLNSEIYLTNEGEINILCNGKEIKVSQ